jgi:hypothetical protein
MSSFAKVLGTLIVLTVLVYLSPRFISLQPAPQETDESSEIYEPSETSASATPTRAASQKAALNSLEARCKQARDSVSCLRLAHYAGALGDDVREHQALTIACRKYASKLACGHLAFRLWRQGQTAKARYTALVPCKGRATPACLVYLPFPSGRAESATVRETRRLNIITYAMADFVSTLNSIRGDGSFTRFDHDAASKLYAAKVMPKLQFAAVTIRALSRQQGKGPSRSPAHASTSTALQTARARAAIARYESAANLYFKAIHQEMIFLETGEPRHLRKANSLYLHASQQLKAVTALVRASSAPAPIPVRRTHLAANLLTTR